MLQEEKGICFRDFFNGRHKKINDMEETYFHKNLNLNLLFSYY